MYKIGDVFTALKNYPFNIEKEVENDEDSYDIYKDENFKIIAVIDGKYKVNALAGYEIPVRNLITEKEILEITSKNELSY